MAQAQLSLPRAAAEGRKNACPDTVAGLMAEVADIVGDPAVGESEILRALGRGLMAAAAAARLPGLAAEAQLPFPAGQGHAALPADMQHGPVYAFLLPGRSRVRVAPDLAALRREIRFGARGRIRCVAVGGGRLFARPAPTADATLTVGYYRLPDPLVTLSDKPACLPPHLAGPLLVSFACREIFERLEEGAEGKKPQTAAYARRFEAALAELVALAGPAVIQEEPVDVPGSWDGGLPVFGEDWP
ncbi:conserved hypothetical protein [Solidesulfovibrio fructosivorans JJ]]|uniref:Uncharacterized protein n=1 Tax=Solidesulfovibrio fructosivorans JJ] TaxID=596151 RepID=E1JS54_SOLFR|nr:hypothetical protein [Solidesulfovibrio fructosivorans]EFL52823.1 conserved hypothetical protein [Solidesulfovibrio fructosivorans JJ]]